MKTESIEVAKLYHFDSDRDRLFRRMAAPEAREPRTPQG
jgi:hypothetical protein